MRFVICEPGPQSNAWHMPGATLERRTWVNGGQRTLYGLAAALAVNGYDVELRGAICPDASGEIYDAVGVSPRLPRGSRRPRADDVVISSAGLRDPLHFARLLLSPARVVLMLLEPPGLFGWPFAESWEPPDPRVVDIATLAAEEHFQSMSSLGLTLWTNNEHVARRAADAGVECRWLGLGQPLPFPEPGVKQFDVALIEDNRWCPLAEQVLGELDDCSSLRIGRAPREHVLAQLGASRMLIWPSRIEGHSRIQCEARAMGTVPVALPNPFAVGLDEANGAIVVEKIEEMARVIAGLKSNPARLSALSELGIHSSRDAEDWDAYVARVAAAARDVLDSPRVVPYGPMGHDIERILAEPLDVFEAAASERLTDLQDAHAEIRRMTEDLHALQQEVLYSRLELDRLRHARPAMRNAAEALTSGMRRRLGAALPRPR